MADLSPECYDKGFVWDGETTGVEKKFGGLDTYVAEPAGPTTKAVLLIADIHGWEPKNTRLIADEFAKKGYLAVLPDFFFGEPIRSDFTPEDRAAWNAKHGPPAIQEKLGLIYSVLDALKKAGITKVGVEGFCWGGFYAAELGVSGQADAIVITHGSRITAKQVSELVKPTIFLCAETDGMIPEAVRKEFLEILSKKDIPSSLKVYPGTTHGFSVRGDKSDPDLAAKAQDALFAAIAWLDTHISEE